MPQHEALMIPMFAPYLPEYHNCWVNNVGRCGNILTSNIYKQTFATRGL